MPLSEIQRALCRLYDVSISCDVADFVCDAKLVSATAGEEHARGEVLLVAEDEEGIAVGLYVDPQALAALAAGEGEGDGWMDDGRRWALCLATEGVSHFIYLVFRADNDTPVSQLELELQAEVDKYASAVLGDGAHGETGGQALLTGNGVGAIRARSREVRSRLFTSVRFIDAAGSDRGDRYRTAHRLAARYAESLERRHLATGDLVSFRRELRRFYRRGLREKLEQLQ